MARNNSKVRLTDDDWTSLFPGKEHTIGQSKILLVPLSLQSLAFIAEKFSSVAKEISRLEMTPEDFTSTDASQITNLVKLIIDKVPEVLSEMSGIDEEDIKQLPLTPAVELFNACLDVNIASQESLVKNFKELGEKFRTFTKMPETPIVQKRTLSAQKTH